MYRPNNQSIVQNLQIKSYEELLVATTLGEIGVLLSLQADFITKREVKFESGQDGVNS